LLDQFFELIRVQLDRALQDRILVPWHKGEPEKFKTAWDLLVADKGGLTFQPVMGMHDNVAEMIFPPCTHGHKSTISPRNHSLSLLPRFQSSRGGYNICEKREGCSADPGPSSMAEVFPDEERRPDLKEIT
jgi:hypothetical protein